MAARLPRIDALRGLAVFGIMLVNIWGFVYGYGLISAPAGPAMSNADRIAIFVCAAFAEQKFYPIFSFLFGAGFALQTGRASLPAVAAAYQRRLVWLLVCGLLHAGLLWFGDILVAYALTGFWLSTLIGVRPARLLRVFQVLVLVNIITLGVTAMLYAEVAGMPHKALLAQIDEFQRAHVIYTSGSWSEIARQRLNDFLGNVASFVFTLPRLALLFMCGVLAVRLGWLARPERHRRAWRVVLWIGLGAGLPLNLWWGAVSVASAADPIGTVGVNSLGMVTMEMAGPLLASGFIALFMLSRPGVARILAPVGRMALTNYLMQSLLLTLLLQGVGLGFGAWLTRAELLGVAAAVGLFQLGFSHWWLKRHQQGPMEALWRSYSR